MGSVLILNDTASGGAWSMTNGDATIVAGTVTPAMVGLDTALYAVSNSCGSDTARFTFSINPLPATPVISTFLLNSVCTGTLYQNFGATVPPAVGNTYVWSAVNATVWATSPNGQFAIVSFPNAGNAEVMLTDKVATTGCSSLAIDTVAVSGAIAQTPTVLYFQFHFVCLPADEDSYQWGYDDAVTFQSTELVGEINQDYLNTNPDAGKNYWVRTTKGGCSQKTYLSVPTAIGSVNAALATVNLYPNPADGMVKVVVSSFSGSEIQLEIVDMVGQTVAAQLTVRHCSSFDVSGFPIGNYILNCYSDGLKVAVARFIKQ